MKQLSGAWAAVPPQEWLQAGVEARVVRQRLSFLLCLLLCLLGRMAHAQQPPPGSDEEQRVRAIAAARKSVVSVRTYRAGYTRAGVGSGVIMRSDGFIMTNAHVVEGAKIIKVSLPSGQQYTARVWGKIDKANDIALLKIDASGLPVMRMGDSAKVELGQTAIAIGDPLSFAGTVTTGTVSGMGREVHVGSLTYKALIQTDAAINPGSSGGALINTEGQMIGMNTLVYISRGGHTQGMGFAIPINHARQVAAGLISLRPTTGATKAWLGISGADLTPDKADGYGIPARHGVIVTAITPGSPASSGLQVGDAITECDKHTVLSVTDFMSILNTYKPGDTVKLSLWRQAKKITVPVTLDIQSQ